MHGGRRCRQTDGFAQAVRDEQGLPGSVGKRGNLVELASGQEKLSIEMETRARSGEHGQDVGKAADQIVHHRVGEWRPFAEREIGDGAQVIFA